MMLENDVLKISVGGLIANFRGALEAMVPFAESLKMDWRDGQQHRDWESLAEAIFDAMVRGPIGADQGIVIQECKLARYDIDHDSYADLSWVEVSAGGSVGPFVRLYSVSEPFDSAEIAVLDPEMRRVEAKVFPLNSCQFAYRRNVPGRGMSRVEFISAVE